MDDLDRRRFLGGAVSAAAAIGGGGAAAREASPTLGAALAADVPAPAEVTLGKTGIKTTRLAQGTGVKGFDRQSDQTRMGFERFVPLFRHAYDRGLRFFDLADLYGTHVYFREALKAFDRESVTILTKLWWRYDGPEDQTSAAFRAQVTRSALERFRHEMATDYVDIVLLHCLTDADWPQKMQPYLDELLDAKERRHVRAVGVSCHDFGAMKTAAETPWVELILARTNPEGVKMDASPAEVDAVLRTAKANGKAVVGMKIFGEGELADQRERCIEYAQSRDYLDAMTIGFHTPEQIDDVLRLLARYPVGG
jgi:aryl-alcohol dehydrogenase-like predicted oxidoreductase